MAFIGVAVVKQVSDGLVRIAGLSLDNADGGGTSSGTISLFEKAAPDSDVRLPAGFKPRDYDRPDSAPLVSLQDSVECWFVYLDPGTVLQPISVVKTGTTPEDFVITLTDTYPPGVIPEPPLPPPTPVPTGELEIYVKFH